MGDTQQLRTEFLDKTLIMPCLKLLGFNPKLLQTEYNIKFCKEDFSISTIAQKLAVYHLMICWNPEWERILRCHLPFFETVQPAYSEVIKKMLEEIEKRENVPLVSNILFKNIFSKMGKTRMDALLFSLFELLFNRELKESSDEHIMPQPEFSNTANLLMKKKTEKNLKDYIHLVEGNLMEYRKCKSFAGNQESEMRNAISENEVLKERLILTANNASQVPLPEGQPKNPRDVVGELFIKLHHLSEELKPSFSTIESFVKNQEENSWIIIDDILTRGINRPRSLDKSEINVEVPNILRLEKTDEIASRNVNSIHGDGDLEIMDLLNLILISIQVYNEKLQKGSVPSVPLDTIKQILNDMKNQEKGVEKLKDFVEENISISQVPELKVLKTKKVDLFESYDPNRCKEKMDKLRSNLTLPVIHKDQQSETPIKKKKLSLMPEEDFYQGPESFHARNSGVEPSLLSTSLYSPPKPNEGCLFSMIQDDSRYSQYSAHMLDEEVLPDDNLLTNSLLDISNEAAHDAYNLPPDSLLDISNEAAKDSPNAAPQSPSLEAIISRYKLIKQQKVTNSNKDAE